MYRIDFTNKPGIIRFLRHVPVPDLPDLVVNRVARLRRPMRFDNDKELPACPSLLVT